MIHIKSKQEIDAMREAGRLTACVMQEISAQIRAGISTLDLDKFAQSRIMAYGGIPSFKGYHGYPASICASVNDQVVHGIPSARKRLKEGDIISIDLGVIYRGFQGDMARTYAVGSACPEAQKLMDVTKECFYRGMDAARVGNRIGDVGWAVQSYAESFGYGVVRDLTGHGIGREMHEDPSVPNFGTPGRGVRLRAGMVICIEPMINIGTWEVDTAPDGWTMSSADGSLSAHYENTVAILEEGPEILTRV